MIDLSQCPCSGRTLGKMVQPAIVATLAQEALHGYRIAEHVAHMPAFKGRRPDPTGVYRLLRSMEKRGLVLSSWDLSASGPARRLYRLTGDGERCLSRWIETLRNYRQTVGQLLEDLERAAEDRRLGASDATEAHPEPEGTRN